MDAAVDVDLDDADVLFATYPKTGKLMSCKFMWFNCKCNWVKSIAVFRIEQQRISNFRLTISGQTWTLTLLSHIFQAKELEAGKEFSLDDFWGKLPFMETEWFNGGLTNLHNLNLQDS